MPDYNKACIYLIKHNLDYNNENVYIGSCCNFIRRKCQHKSNCNNPNNNLKIYQTIRENGGWDNWVMVRLHNFPCNEKYQLKLEERRVIDLYQSKLNCNIPSRTAKEWYEDNKEELSEKQKIYYENNKEDITEKMKKWRENNKEKLSEIYKKYYENNKAKIKENVKIYSIKNKEKITEKNKEYYDDNKEKITCECGAIVVKTGLSRHRESLKHILFFYNMKRNQKII